MRETQRAIGSNIVYSSERPTPVGPRRKPFDIREALLRMLPEVPVVMEIGQFNERALRAILEWAYGPKDWRTTNQESEWTYLNPQPETKRTWTPEVQKTYRNLRAILEWTHDPETRGHLDPAPGIPLYDEKGQLSAYREVSFGDGREIDHAVADLAKYYYNGGETEKITPLLALNQKGKVLGVITIRWSGNPYGPQKHKYAYVERILVNPKIRRMGVGTQMRHEGESLAFEKGYPEVRTWVMTDTDNWERVFGWFIDDGYDIVQGPDGDWETYVERRRKEGKQMPETKRKAKQLILRREDWDKRKKVQPQIEPRTEISPR